MLTFWKLNHEQTLQWEVDGDEDLSTFIIIVSEKATDFGLSTYLYSNRKARKAILNKCVLVGRHTLHPISQFDARLESGVTSLKEGMPIIGKNALRAFLEANSHRSFTHALLERVLTHADLSSLEGQPEELPPVDLDYLSS